MAGDDQERTTRRGLRFSHWVTLSVVAVCVVLIPYALLPRARESARRQACCQNLSAIACGCYMYANDYQGRYPQKWSEIYPNWVNDIRCFLCPSRGIRPLQEDALDSQTDYVLVPGLTWSSPQDWIAMYDRYPHSGDLVNVVRVGSIHAQTISLRELEAQLKRQGAGP